VEEVETILAEAMRLKVNAEVVVVNSVAKEPVIILVEMHVLVPIAEVLAMTDLTVFLTVHKEAATHVLLVILEEADAATHVLRATVNSVVNAAAAILAILARLAISVATVVANHAVRLAVNFNQASIRRCSIILQKNRLIKRVGFFFIYIAP
jgi:hypothetical protein